VLGIEGSDCAWSFVDRMFLANELLDAADAAGKLSAWLQDAPAGVHRLDRGFLHAYIGSTIGLAGIAAQHTACKPSLAASFKARTAFTIAS